MQISSERTKSSLLSLEMEEPVAEEGLIEFEEMTQNEDPPVRGTRSLHDIYQRCNIVVCEPVGFEEAAKDVNWKIAMNEEMTMINKNNTWELVERPKDRKVIGLKWVFRTKMNVDGSVNRHKARLENFLESTILTPLLQLRDLTPFA